MKGEKLLSSLEATYQTLTESDWKCLLARKSIKITANIERRKSIKAVCVSMHGVRYQRIVS